MAGKRIEVQIVGDTKDVERAFGRVGRESNNLSSHLRTLGKASAIAIGVGVGAGLVGLGLAAKASIGELVQAQKAAAQTAAVIKSTGGAAHVTAKHVDELSSSLLKKTGIDDEVIQAGENMLLTFRNVRNETGKSNKIFDQATKIGLDMSTALQGAGFEGGSLQTTMIRLGKALNDPVTGMTALRRVGVTFSESQKTTIKRLEETGHHLQAQKIILRELRAEFGGSAEAFGKTLPGRITILRESLKNAGATILGYLVPALETGMKAVGRFSNFVGKVAGAKDFSAAFKISVTGAQDLGASIGMAIKHAFTGSTKTVEAGSQGYVQIFQKGILQADWSGVGSQLATAIGDSITFSGDALNNLLGSLLAWSAAHARQIAEVGATIAVNIALALTDPAFWAHHMDLLAAVLVVGFGRGFGKLGVGAGRIIVRALGGPFERAAGELSLLFVRGMAALPRGLYDAFVLAGRTVVGGIRTLFREVSGVVSEEAGRVSTFLGRAFRFGAVVTVFRLVVSELQGVWSSFSSWVKENALRTVAFIVEPFSHLPYRLGGWAREVKSSVNAQLRGIEAERTARRIETMGGRIGSTQGAIRRTAGAIRALGDAINATPSDLTIRFIVKTLSFTPGASPRGAFQGGGHAAGGRIPGTRIAADSVPAMLSPGEFVVTGGGERMLESMTFPGVLNWLQRAQPRHFAGGGRAGSMTKNIEYDRMYQAPMGPAGGGGPISTHGLVAQVVRALAFARGHGWHGGVISGFRTYAEQKAIWDSGVRPAAFPGTSNHEFGRAVDVSDAYTFDRLMNEAPPGSRLYNLVPNDFAHFSTTGYRAGGGAKKRLPKNRPSAKYRGDPFTSYRPGPGSPAKLRRPRVLADPSVFPLAIQEAIADADLTDPTTDDIVAYMRAEQYLNKQLRSPRYSGNPAARIQLKQALKSVRDTLSSLRQAAADTGDGTGQPDTTADLQAQLDQAKAQLAASGRSAALANSFVATGVFATQAGASSGGGVYVFPSVFPPTAEQVRQAGGIVAQAAGDQGFRVASSQSLGV